MSAGLLRAIKGYAGTILDKECSAVDPQVGLEVQQDLKGVQE